MLSVTDSKFKELPSTLSNTNTFGTGSQCTCVSTRDVRLIESKITEVKKGRDQL